MSTNSSFVLGSGAGAIPPAAPASNPAEAAAAAEQSLSLPMPEDVVPGIAHQSHDALGDLSADLPGLLDNPSGDPQGIPAASPSSSLFGSDSLMDHDVPPLGDEPVQLPDLEIAEMWAMMKNGGAEESLQKMLEQSKQEANSKAAISKPEKAAQSNGSSDPKKSDKDKAVPEKASPTDSSKEEQSLDASEPDLLKKIASVLIKSLFNSIKSASLLSLTNYRGTTSRVIDEVSEKIKELEKPARQSSEDEALQTALISKLGTLKFQLKELDKGIREYMDKKTQYENKQNEKSVLSGIDHLSPFSLEPKIDSSPETVSSPAPAPRGHIMNDTPSDMRSWDYDQKDPNTIILKSALRGIVNREPGNTGLTSDSADRALNGTVHHRYSSAPLLPSSEPFDACLFSLSVDHMPDKAKRLLGLRQGMSLGDLIFNPSASGAGRGLNGSGSRGAPGAIGGLPVADSRSGAGKDAEKEKEKSVPLTREQKLAKRFGRTRKS